MTQALAPVDVLPAHPPAGALRTSGRRARFALTFARRLFLVAMGLGALAIGSASLSYFEEGALHPFVVEKMPAQGGALWLAALFVHVVSALFALPACLLLSTRTLLARAPAVHRWLGRAVGLAILVALVPSGLLLSTTATGGALGAAGFVATGLVTAVAMIAAIRAARRRDFIAHRRAIAHVVAQLSVAVVSRAMLAGLDALELEALAPDAAYVAALWAPVALAIVGAELVTRRRALTF